MPRVGFPGGPRLEYYDRNPAPGLVSWTADGIAPHGATIRASYTVPTGKKALIVGGTAMMMRATAATTLGRARAYGATPTSIVFDLFHKSNTVDSLQQVVSAVSYVIYAGITTSLVTADASTGGTIDYNVYLTYTEFSA